MKVTKLFHQERLDKFIVANFNLARHQVDKLFANNQILLNGVVPFKKGINVKLNDEVSILKQQEKLQRQPTKKIKLPIVYEDKDVIVINKPKNILVHPTSFGDKNTIVQILSRKIKKKEFADQTRPGVVSRIDRNTTGLCIIAKNKYMFDSLLEQTKKRIMIKQYLAIVHHCFQDKFLLIKAPIERSKQSRLKMVVSDEPKAKPATTEITVLENFRTASLISCKLITGRTHQIRCHLAYIHHPVYNDPLYGTIDGFKDYDQFLHCNYLKFYHPRLDKFIELNCEPDKVFNDLLIKLRSNL
ncbi:MAG: RluA family pseudouridine synthase [Mycoplasmataceae bacterium]|jgi:23S rRNA pseudouridine1911/1915/1917 synthase|nr:RluA family pseudouridine synthase [Mycoplasmataceae bacterium]